MHVPGLRSTVSALVMDHSPCLLSVGQLVARGYKLLWTPTECTLRCPAGEDIPLRVEGGIPMMPDEDGRTPWSSGRVLTSAVRGGVDEEHRQHGHYPWRPDCGSCCAAAMRSQQHRRRLPHAGALAVDVAAVEKGGPYVLVGATQVPGWVYAEPLRSKAARDLRAPLLRMLASARTRGAITRVHGAGPRQDDW